MRIACSRLPGGKTSPLTSASSTSTSSLSPSALRSPDPVGTVKAGECLGKMALLTGIGLVIYKNLALGMGNKLKRNGPGPGLPRSLSHGSRVLVRGHRFAMVIGSNKEFGLHSACREDHG